MEFFSLLNLIILVGVVFGALATKVALVTEIAPLYVAVYLAVLIAVFSFAVRLWLSRRHERAQRDQFLESCWAQAAEQQKLSAAEIKNLRRDYLRDVSAVNERNRSLNLRLTDLSTCYKSSQQDVTRLQASLRQAMTWTVDSGRVENARKIESQWYLLRDIMVEGGIQASNEYEWVCEIRKLVQRKPAPSDPTGVVSADLEKAREELAKETAAKNAAQYKIGRLDNQIDIANKTVRIQEIDIEELKDQNELKQRMIDDLKERLNAVHQKDSTGCQEKLAQLQQQLRAEQKKLKDAEDTIRSKSRTIKDHGKTLKKLHQEIEDLTTAKDALAAEKTELQQELADSQAAEKQKDSALAEKELEISKLERHSLELDSNLSMEIEQKNRFSDALNESQALLSSAKEELASARNELTSAKNAANTPNSEQTTRISALVQQNDQLQWENKKQSEELKAVVDNGNALVTQMQENFNNMSADKDAYISKLQSDYDFINALYAQSEAELANIPQPTGDANAAVPAPTAARPMTNEEWDQYMANQAAVTDGMLQKGEEIVARFNSNFTSDEIEEASRALPQPQLSTNDNMAQTFNTGGDASSQVDLSPFINSDLAPGLNITDDPDWDAFIDFNNANPAT